MQTKTIGQLTTLTSLDSTDLVLVEQDGITGGATLSEVFSLGSRVSDTTLLNGWTGTVEYIIRRGVCFVNLKNLDGSSSTDSTAYILPEGYRPTFTVYGTAVGLGGADEPVSFFITSGGTLSITTSNTQIRGSIMFPLG